MNWKDMHRALIFLGIALALLFTTLVLLALIVDYLTKLKRGFDTSAVMYNISQDELYD